MYVEEIVIGPRKSVKCEESYMTIECDASINFNVRKSVA